MNPRWRFGDRSDSVDSVDDSLAAILAAEMYCRERRAMLIVDPHFEWERPEDALRGVPELGYASPNMLGYFPRIRDGSDPDGAITDAEVAAANWEYDPDFSPHTGTDPAAAEALKSKLVDTLATSRK